MLLKPKDTAGVLATFIKEDRVEARIYRTRVQNVSYSLVLASFAISGFLIGNVRMGAAQLRYVTLLIDLGLVAVLCIFYLRIRPDLVLLRKGMKARQDVLHSLRESGQEMQEVNVFPRVEEVVPDIKDDDLRLVVQMCATVVLIKMLVLALVPGVFVVPKGTP